MAIPGGINMTSSVIFLILPSQVEMIILSLSSICCLLRSETVMVGMEVYVSLTFINGSTCIPISTGPFVNIGAGFLSFIPKTIFDKKLGSEKLINILPTSFKPFEDKALEIIEATQFNEVVANIKNEYFEGRLVV